MAYKVSKYNYVTTNDNGNYLACNLIRGLSSLQLIPADSKHLVDIILHGETTIDDTQVSQLRKYIDTGLIVDEKQDELFTIKSLYNDKVNANVLNLIIMTTGQCNFRCKYCYENFDKDAMSEDIQIRLLKYIQKQLNIFGKISIEWFGGEPLVELNVIKNIMHQINRMCEAKKAHYRAGITTNGYLLTPSVFKQLYDLRVLTYQITIDGIKEQHDAQRVLRNGHGTFERIINNLIFIRDNKAYNKVNITIRVNLTKPIADHIADFLRFYKQEFGNDRRFNLLFKQAENLNNNDLMGFEDKLITDENMGVSDLLKKHKILNSTDYDLNNALDVLTPMSNICYASMKNSYVVDPKGMVYKCTVHFDKKCNQIGYIDNNGNMILDQYAHSLWYMKKEELSDMCRNCKYLPICYGGGCSYYANFKSTKECCAKDIKRHVEDYMQYIARFMKIEQ